MVTIDDGQVKSSTPGRRWVRPRRWLRLGRAYLLLLLTVLALAPTIVAAAEALPGSPSGSPIAKASLIADAEAISAGVPFTLAVHLQLLAGWHTYWSNPGEAGAPTHVEWRLPQGFTIAPLAWPIPERLSSGSIVSYGYTGDVWLSARITPPVALSPGTMVPLAAAVDWLACAEICVPEQAEVALTLPVVAEEATMARPAAPAIARAFAVAAAQVPLPVQAPLVVSRQDGAMVVAISSLDAATAATAPSSGAVTGAWFFPDAFGQIDDAAPQTLERGADGLRLRLVRPANVASVPPDLSGVLVLERTTGRIGYTVRAPAPS